MAERGCLRVLLAPAAAARGGSLRSKRLPLADLFGYLRLLALVRRGLPTTPQLFESGFHKSGASRFRFWFVASAESHVQIAPFIISMNLAIDPAEPRIGTYLLYPAEGLPSPFHRLRCRLFRGGREATPLGPGGRAGMPSRSATSRGRSRITAPPRTSPDRRSFSQIARSSATEPRRYCLIAVNRLVLPCSTSFIAMSMVLPSAETVMRTILTALPLRLSVSSIVFLPMRFTATDVTPGSPL